MAFKVVQLIDMAEAPDYNTMFKKAGVDVELVKKPLRQPTEDDLINAVGDADAVITATTVMAFSRQVLAGLKKCRFIMSIGIGYEKLDVHAATELGILTANVPDASLEEVSDHAMALILACTRRIVQINDGVRRGDWRIVGSPIRTEVWPKMSRMRGQVLGLIGFGRIARTLVPKAKGFGLRIVGYDPYVPEDSFKQLGVEKVVLDRLIAESDIVSIHIPMSAETRGLLRLEQLKKMKPSACLVNTARGGIVDQDALYTALSRGYISCAAVDVTEPEPLPMDSPLLKLSNFVVTAHSAHASPVSAAEQFRRPAEEIIRVVKGEWPVGLIDPRVKEKYLEKFKEKR